MKPNRVELLVMLGNDARICEGRFGTGNDARGLLSRL